MRLFYALLSGIVFGAGIALSGMINPAKVQNFFDVAGTWDPSLAFVMGGAVLVTYPGYKLIFRRSQPLSCDRFHVPDNSAIDRRLVMGSAIFGIGWGIAGFCAGAAIPALATGHPEVFLFVASVIAGLFLNRWSQSRAAGDSAS